MNRRRRPHVPPAWVFLVALIGPASCSGADGSDVSGPDPVGEGTVQVSITTAQASENAPADPDGYRVRVGANPAQMIDSNGTVTFPSIPAGDHVLDISGAQENCTTPGGFIQNIAVSSGRTTSVAVAITCWPHPAGSIAFSRNVGAAEDLYVLDVGGSAASRLTSEGGPNLWPAWSPDGRQIAFTSQRDGSINIWVMDADGGNQRALTQGSTRDVVPVWSPDGSKIGFSRAPESSSSAFDIYIMDADGSNLVEVPGTGGYVLDDWSPDGTKLLATRSTSIWEMDMDGTNKVELGSGSTGRWSPNGSSIVLARDDTGEGQELFVMNRDGSGAHQITTGAGHAFSPRWSADGLMIAFHRQGFGTGGIFLMYADGTGVRGVTENLSGLIRYPSWSP